MELAQLLNNVVEITKRPDARARSLLALNSVIADVVTNYDYPEDLLEETFFNTSAQSPAVIALPDGLPKIRSIAYLSIRGGLLKGITPRQALSGGCQALDVYYMSGANIIVNSRYSDFTEMRVGYYPVPINLIEGTLEEHWLLDKYPAMLLNGAVARTFKATGDDDSAVFYEREFLQLRAQMRRSQLED